MRPLFSAARWRKGGRPARGGRPAPTPAPRPAAGLLLRYSDFEGDWYLLGLRSRRLGGTWSNIGGSLNAGEHPLVGALRELHEECEIPTAGLAGARIAQGLQPGNDRVPYTLVVIDVPNLIDDARLGWENDDLAWFPADEVASLELHTGFARAWPEICIQRVNVLLEGASS